ncbi:hypothetical protein [Chlorobium phaeobacteroides]|jgi:hypothetical protein|uniref:Uncharacterized protein n=1 Tax=Chlorobium phaeobacteroides (strain DSM 266 / SMG 266 / 2430) TaxID=290317 RepID=A1BF19_CHLPD|nr:hypothetical protein [Chlorobium phaeobacteroides]ABL64996.1 conserved hypothetical protein [Chlorobium phaeobacteroides DSM 266]MBV5326901.1 hypothetical protein [Chlorobium sp.]
MKFKEADLPLEVAILVICGMVMLITGGLLFPVSQGTLPYYENGLYGLLLIIFALQMITAGKTPLGDMHRSKPLLAVGVLIAAAGIVTCFIPVLNPLPRFLLFLCFGPGGLLLFLQMLFARDKFRRWVQYGGIFRYLIFGCGSVYVLSMIIGLLLWKRSLLTTPMMAVVVILFGIAISFLAGVLWKIYLRYPEAERGPEGDVGLSTDHALLMLMGVFLLLLGVLLIPVNLGLLPFSGSAQLGLLMVIFSIQMLASGSTPIGTFTRSWPLLGFGLLFAASGIVSCIIPDILVSTLTVVVGILNILGGAIALAKMWDTRFRKPDDQSKTLPPIVVRLFAAQLTMNLLSIIFGSSMLIPGLVHGLVVGVILVANGCVLLYLLRILLLLDNMRGDMGLPDNLE